MVKKLFDFVFCCLSHDQNKTIELALENHDPKPVYHAQEDFIREKHGYRCVKCGNLYPYLQLDHQGTLIDPKRYSKPTGTLRKGKKAAVVFSDRYYYAHNKKTLLEFEMNSDGEFRTTDTIPVMGGVYHTVVSHDEKYIATETFGGTIEIVDVETKEHIAKRQKTPINGSYIFTPDHKLFYFYKDAIRLWDYSENSDSIVWMIPKEWKKSEDPRKQIHIICKNIIYNRKDQTYLFVCDAREITYIVSVKDMKLKQVIQLPGIPANGKMVFEENLNQYTLSTTDKVVVYDADFRAVEIIMPPRIIRIHDGGGMFPITRHVSQSPNRTFLSPDGKWLLLDYFTSVILIRHEDLSIKFCLYSYTGKVAQHMGFVDCNHFWYTWGDTTYIQEIEK